tara:strand:- start:4815 stop:6428 length:1614 start_codon:yes stop_codon:yes gene_type:complete
MNTVKLKRALISVADKTDIIPLAQALQQSGCEIISTGGTLKVLEEAGVAVTNISAVTKNPEAFGGRMKTISFEIESSILFNRDTDAQEAASLGIKPLDLVVCNFYPFEKVYKEGASLEDLVENVDIGGPTMIRAAAKNFKHVTALTDPADYADVIEELSVHEGATTLALRQRLMRKAFHLTADYDALIATAFDKEAGIHSLRLAFSDGKPLRYGENPHQKAFFFKERKNENSLYDINILNGKELSFNNLLDVNSAIDCVRELGRSACAVIKHNVPCGLSEGENQRRVLELAWQSDPVSAFGSVIAFNKPVAEETVQFFGFGNEDKSQRKFVEVIIAPSFELAALDILKKQKNLRVIEFDTAAKESPYELKYFKGSLLLQDKDEELFQQLDCPTKKKAHFDEGLARFGVKAVRQVRSNAIAVVRKVEGETYQLLGMGAGQPNRLTSVALALDKCKDNLSAEYQGPAEQQSAYLEKELSETLLLSEAFFPFPDSVDACAKHGVKAILQPGGSIRDADIIERCDEYDIAMLLTGVRHFKH